MRPDFMSDDSNIRPERLFEVAAAYAQADPEELKIFMAYFHQVLKRTAEKEGKQLGFDMDVSHGAFTAAMLQLAEEFAPAGGKANSEIIARLRRMRMLQS